MNWGIFLSSAGGVLVIIGAAVTVARATFRQVQATKDNTDALGEVRDELQKMNNKVNGHDVRIAVLEDRKNRP